MVFLDEPEPFYKGLGILDRTAGGALDDVVDQQEEADLVVLLLQTAGVDNHSAGFAPEGILWLREGVVAAVLNR